MNSLSKKTEAIVTLTIDGEERDRGVRAWMLVEPDLGMGGSWGAAVDGGRSNIDVYVGDDWWPLEELALSERDMEVAEEALCERAMEDMEECG